MRARQSNFEILRVLAMSFIVTWHFIVHGIMHVLTSVNGGGRHLAIYC